MKLIAIFLICSMISYKGYSKQIHPNEFALSEEIANSTLELAEAQKEYRKVAQRLHDDTLKQVTINSDLRNSETTETTEVSYEINSKENLAAVQ